MVLPNPRFGKYFSETLLWFCCVNKKMYKTFNYKNIRSFLDYYYVAETWKFLFWLIYSNTSKLVDSRYIRNMPIRNSDYILKVREAQEEKNVFKIKIENSYRLDFLFYFMK